MRTEARPLIIPIAVQGGHALWMALGLALLGRWDLDLLDIVILVVGIIWLMIRPGFGPVALLVLYQLAALIVNSLVFGSTAVGSSDHKALVVHMFLRIISLIALWVGLYQMYRNESSNLLST